MSASDYLVCVHVIKKIAFLIRKIAKKYCGDCSGRKFVCGVLMYISLAAYGFEISEIGWCFLWRNSYGDL